MYGTSCVLKFCSLPLEPHPGAAWRVTLPETNSNFARENRQNPPKWSYSNHPVSGANCWLQGGYLQKIKHPSVCLYSTNSKFSRRLNMIRRRQGWQNGTATCNEGCGYPSCDTCFEADWGPKWCAFLYFSQTFPKRESLRPLQVFGQPSFIKIDAVLVGSHLHFKLQTSSLGVIHYLKIIIGWISPKIMINCT